ncbi:putative ribonuclease H-like domain-containing protein [Tanacetum coccineum]
MFDLAKNLLLSIFSSDQQFWQTASTSTLEDGEVEITATIDGQLKTITEASLRDISLFRRCRMVCSSLHNTKIFEQLALMRYASDFDKLTFQKGITLVTPTKTSTQEDHPEDQLGVLSELMVKRLEKIVKSRKARRRAKNVMSDDEKVSEDSFNQGRMIDDIDQDARITLSNQLHVDKKDKERAGYEAAIKLQEQLDQEESQRIAKDAEIALRLQEEIDVVGRTAIGLKYFMQLIQKLQAEEREKYSEVDQAKMLVDLINQRKRFFAQQRAEAKRNKPMTQAQQRTYMSNYIKNQEGVQRLKRAGQEVLEEPAKRQKIGEASGSGEEQSAEKKKRSIRRRTTTISDSILVLRRGFQTSTKPTVDKEKVLWVELKRSDQAEEGPTNFALMAYTSSGFSSSSSSDFEVLIKQFRDNALTMLRKKFEKVEKERDDLKLTLEKFGNSSKNLSKLLEIQGNPQLELQDKRRYLWEVSVARTPQQNGVADRKNRTLIEGRGKFDGKADEGFFIGYYVNSKAFRGVDQNDTLTKSMNYKPVVAGNKTNGNAGTKESIYAGQAGKKTVPSHEYILLPLWTPDSPISSSPKRSDDEVADDAGKKSTKDPANDGKKAEINIKSTNNISSVSSPINTAGTKDVDDEPMMPNTSIFGDAYDDEDFVAGGDMNNLESSMSTLVDLPYGKRAIGTKWVYRNKKDERGIVVRNKARLVTQGYTQEEGIDYDEVFALVARSEEIRLFLAYASFKDFVVYQMDMKSAFLYGKIEEEVYVCQPLGFEDPEFPDRVYKVENALYGLHQAPRAWYETLSTYLLENRFQRGTIDKTLFIKKFKGNILLVQVYVDDIIFGSTKKELCTEFEKLMHKKFQMSYMGKLTFFLGLQVTQKDDGIFISQDKYVDEILKKFGFLPVKIASKPMETLKPLMNDDNAEDVDVHLYRSMIRSLIYLTSSRPDIIFVDSPFDLEAYTNSDYAGASLDRKSTVGGCQFLESRLISWKCKKQTVVANSTTEAKLMIGMGWKYYLDEIRVYIGNSRVSTAEIVDFLNASPIRYALTVSLTIYVSYIEQFWSTAKTKTVNNETQIRVRVDGKTIVITESTMRRDIYFDDEDAVFNDEYDTPSHTKKVFTNIRRKGKDFSGTVTPLYPFILASQAVEGEGSRQPTEPQHTPTTASPSHDEPIPTVASPSHPKKTHKYKAVQKESGDSVERAATTADSLDAEQDSGDTIAQTRSERVSTPSYDSPLLGVNTPGSDEERIELKELMDMCIKLSDKVLDLENVKDAQALEITKLKKRVKKLERKNKSRTSQPKRRVYNPRVESSEESLEVVLEEEPIDLVEDKGSAEKGVSAAKDKDSTADLVTIAGETVTTASVNPDDVTLAETLMAIRSSASRPQKLKGPEKPVKVKGKDQIEYDADVAQRLQAELDEEARLEREREEEASNAALIEEWDSIKARIDVDAQLEEQMFVEEQQMSVEEQQLKGFKQKRENRCLLKSKLDC